MKEVKELEDQLQRIREELHESGFTHEGQTAEEAYAERLEQLHLDESKGVVQEGNRVVSVLLARCLLWLEVIREKYAPFPFLQDYNNADCYPTGKARLMIVSWIPTRLSSRLEIPSTR